MPDSQAAGGKEPSPFIKTQMAFWHRRRCKTIELVPGFENPLGSSYERTILGKKDISEFAVALCGMDARRTLLAIQDLDRHFRSRIKAAARPLHWQLLETIAEINAELGKDVVALLMTTLDEIAERACCLRNDYEEDFREDKLAGILDFLADFDHFLALIVRASKNRFEKPHMERMKRARQVMMENLEKDTSNPPDPLEKRASDKRPENPIQSPREQRDDTPLRQPGDESWLARRLRGIVM